MSKIQIAIPRNLGRVSPQAKMVNVNRNLGNKGIENQQGTTRTLYDSIALNGKTSFEFFKQPNTALNLSSNSPAGTNVDSQNGLLGVGETMVLKRICFSVVEIDPLTPTKVDKFSSVSGATALAGFTAGGFFAGTFQFKIANQTVLKPVSNMVFLPEFNPSSGATSTLVIFELETEIIVPPILQFVCQVDVPAYTAATKQFLRCTLEGAGAILNTGQNF